VPKEAGRGKKGKRILKGPYHMATILLKSGPITRDPIDRMEELGDGDAWGRSQTTGKPEKSNDWVYTTSKLSHGKKY